MAIHEFGTHTLATQSIKKPELRAFEVRHQKLTRLTIDTEEECL
jgi:hypothetical protein